MYLKMQKENKNLYYLLNKLNYNNKMIILEYILLIRIRLVVVKVKQKIQKLTKHNYKK